MLFPILNIFLFIKLIYRFKSQVTEYVIYESNNNYPRPVLLDNNDVLATSGINGGYMIKYNTNGEIILNRTKLIDYYDNAAIQQLKGNDKRYVLVSGSGNFEIKLFEEDGTVYSTQTSYTTDSYKINILAIADGRILVGWGYQKVNMVYLSQYKLVDNTFIEEKHTEWSSENKYITCIQMESNNAIICQYIHQGCDENFMILKEDFTQIGRTSIYKSPVCAFDKILYMGVAGKFHPPTPPGEYEGWRGWDG